MRYLLLPLLLCLLTTSCGHKADLMTPKEIAKAEQRAAEKAQKDAARLAKQQAREAAKKTEENESSQEVIVP